jgi:putative flavoprotein involved in K+ transport
VPTTNTVVIGAGQAGLAASCMLADRSADHVVLERGRVGQRWRTETWDSLYLLTPNWMNELPGRPYRGADPDGFLNARRFADELADYARSFTAPVVENAGVDLLENRDGRFRIVTGQAAWTADNVVMATGWCDRPAIPAVARALSSDIHQVTPHAYRNPDQLPAGGVLVVGASATGVQLAEELRAVGRDVTVAVGRHTRVPRTYRGMDIYWWLDHLGLLDKTIDEMPDRIRARREPSLQLVGRADRRSLDLASLQADGVRLVGRLTSIDGHRARFADDLVLTVAAAERGMNQLLASIDEHIERNGLRGEVLDPESRPAVAVTPGLRELDLRAAGIRTVVWATGYRRNYPWLRMPVLDRHGDIRQRRGQTPVPGLYVLGQRFQHHRSSNFIGGVGRDATLVAEHIAGRATPRDRQLHLHPDRPLNEGTRSLCPAPRSARRRNARAPSPVETSTCSRR